MTKFVEMDMASWEESYDPICERDQYIKEFEVYHDDERDFITHLPERFVWTYINGEDGDFIKNGRHFVNRSHFIVTLNSWNKNSKYKII